MHRLAKHALRLVEIAKQKQVDAEAIWEAALAIGLTSEHQDQHDNILVSLPARETVKECA
jgi:hypothetical protein